VSDDRKTKEALDRLVGRVAQSSVLKTAGEVRFIKDRGGDHNEWGWNPPNSNERDIDPDYKFDAKHLKPVAATLRSALMALGHIQTARTTFTKIRSARISPDGNIGGKGYVMPIKDIRKQLANCDEALSAVTDTLYDEMQAVHWHPEVDDSGGNPRERGEVKQIMDDVEEIRDDPEEWAEGEESDMSEGGPESKMASGWDEWDESDYTPDDPDPPECPEDEIDSSLAFLKKRVKPLLSAMHAGLRQRGWKTDKSDMMLNVEDYYEDETDLGFWLEASGLPGQTRAVGRKKIVLDREVYLQIHGTFTVGTEEVEVEEWSSPSGHPNDPNLTSWSGDAECPDGDPVTFKIELGNTSNTYPANNGGVSKFLQDFDKLWPRASKVRSKPRRRRRANVRMAAAMERVALRWLARRPS
jgi:hypothetical protein